MNVLVFFDATEIKGWLLDGRMDQVDEFIDNGYPDLREGYDSGAVKAVVIDVPEAERFSSEMYEIKAGEVSKKA